MVLPADLDPALEALLRLLHASRDIAALKLQRRGHQLAARRNRRVDIERRRQVFVHDPRQLRRPPRRLARFTDHREHRLAVKLHDARREHRLVMLV